MESAGARLKKIRQELGISLEEAQKKTKIHLNILRAIEGDSITNLSPVYLKGFLKIYCKFLGVNPSEYTPDYKETQIPAKDIDTAKPIAQSLKLSSLRPSKKVKTVFVFIIIIIFLSIGLFNLGKLIASKRSSHLLKIRPQNSQKSKIVTNIPIPKPAEATSKKEAASGIRLVIRARENCWVSLNVDGKAVFQRVLEKGRFESWQAKDRIELSLGNAGAVELEVNGEHFLNLGRRGQALKNIVITPKGLSIGR